MFRKASCSGEILTEVGGEISTQTPTEGGFLMHPKKPEKLFGQFWWIGFVKPLLKRQNIIGYSYALYIS